MKVFGCKDDIENDMDKLVMNPNRYTYWLTKVMKINHETQPKMFKKNFNYDFSCPQISFC